MRDKNLLEVQMKRIVAPLAPEGYTYENRYTLKPPFGPRGQISSRERCTMSVHAFVDESQRERYMICAAIISPSDPANSP